MSLTPLPTLATRLRNLAVDELIKLQEETLVLSDPQWKVDKRSNVKQWLEQATILNIPEIIFDLMVLNFSLGDWKDPLFAYQELRQISTVLKRAQQQQTLSIHPVSLCWYYKLESIVAIWNSLADEAVLASCHALEVTKTSELPSLSCSCKADLAQYLSYAGYLHDAYNLAIQTSQEYLSKQSRKQVSQSMLDSMEIIIAEVLATCQGTNETFILDRALQNLHPNDDFHRNQYSIYYANMLVSSGDYLSAAELLNQIALDNPQTIDSWQLFANYKTIQSQLLQSRGKLKQALQMLDDTIRRVEKEHDNNPATSTLIIAKSELLTKQGYSYAVINLYQEFSPKNWTPLTQSIAYKHLARAHQQLGHQTEFLHFNNQMLEIETRQFAASPAAAYILPLQSTELILNRDTLRAVQEQHHKLITDKRQVTLSAIHDLRSPLMAIKLSLRLPTPYLKTNTIVYATEQIAQVLDQLSEASINTKTAKLQPVHLLTVLHKITAQFNPAIRKKSLKLELSCDDSLFCYAEPTALHRIIENIYSNAIKYTYHNTEITIHVFVLGPEMLRIDISDQGPGIRQEDQKHIFEWEGRSTSKVTDGETSSGYGLFIAQKLAQQLNGNVRFHQRWANATGSIFSINLPRTKTNRNKEIMQQI